MRLLLLLLALLPLLGAKGTSNAPPLRFLHVVETGETFGIADDEGLAFPPGAGTLLILQPRSFSAELQLLDTADESRDVVASLWLEDAVLLTLDAGGVLALDPTTHELERLDATGVVERFDLSALGLVAPRGIAVDPVSRRLHVLDRGRIVHVRVGPDDNYESAAQHGQISEIALPPDWVELRGLAFDPETGHLHVYSPQTRELFELDEDGNVQSVRSFPKVEGHLRALLFAPSQDGTDASARTSLYVAADGRRPAQRPPSGRCTPRPSPRPPPSWRRRWSPGPRPVRPDPACSHRPTTTGRCSSRPSKPGASTRRAPIRPALPT